MGADEEFARATALHEAGRSADAERAYRKLLAADPESPVILTALGNSLKAQGRYDEAMAAHRAALAEAPGFAPAWSNLGLTAQAAGKLDQAITYFGEAVAVSPDDALLRHNLGNALCLRGDFERAAVLCTEALALAHGHRPARITLATCLRELGRIDEALAVLTEAARQAPDDPDVGWNRGLALLLAGRFEEGWRSIEARARIPGLDQAHRQRGLPPDSASAVVGRPVALIAEQGLGDAIQFVRYARLAKERGATSVEVVAPAKLLRLLKSASGVDAVTAARAPEIAASSPTLAGAASFRTIAAVSAASAGVASSAVPVPMFSAPRLFGPPPSGIDGRTPYLAAETARVAALAVGLPPVGLRVGLAWQGNPKYRADARRSLAFGVLRPLLAQRGITFVSLQKDFGAEQLDELPLQQRPRDLGRTLDDGPDAFIDTAAALMNLDLLITTDTALPHLAGALDREVWLLLARVPDWRWGLSGERTAWYPRTRLFRQRVAGDWGPVVAEVAEALRARAAGGMVRT